MPTQSEWRQRILDELGDDGVDVELTVRQLDAAISRALELWAEFKPYGKWFPFIIPAAETVVIDFFAEPEQTDERLHPTTYIRNVLDVRFQNADQRDLIGLSSQRTGLLGGYYLRWGSQGTRLYFELTMAERRYERMTGSRPDWWWEPEERKLYISSPARETRIMAYCTRARTLSEIAYYDERKFLKAATARAKTILARVLGSMGDIPGPAGPITTDAADLRSEGKTEWDEVKEQLHKALTSVPPPTWIG